MINVKPQLKKLAGLVFGKYQVNRIYYLDLANRAADQSAQLPFVTLSGRKQIEELATAEIMNHAWYLSPTSRGYGVLHEHRLVCMCCYWMSGDPRLPTWLFPNLQADEALLVDVLTAGECRGRGYAAALIRYSEQKLKDKGIRRLWTWAWHSNQPSVRMFEKLQWTYAALSVDIGVLNSEKRLRFRMNRSTVS